jgi:hypothetical protein
MTDLLDQLKQFWQNLFNPPTPAAAAPIPPTPSTPQQQLTDAIVTASLAAQRQTGPDMRQIHAKSHGLVWAELIVEPNLPLELQAGLFAEVKTYPAWVRFSNGGAPEKAGHLKADREPDVRGIAIKVMNVPGPKFLDDETETQDFTMSNFPTFFAPNLQDYADLFRARGGGLPPERMKELGPSIARFQQIAGQLVSNPLLIQYWSMAPFRWGETIVKMSVRPEMPETPETPSIDQSESGQSESAEPRSTNYLREAMTESLSKQDIQFDFLVQKFVDETTTPMENLMQEWRSEDSAYIKVATLRIPQQDFNLEARYHLDAGMFFTPWHTIAAHEPIGEVNLARKKLYSEVARQRRETLAKHLREPQPFMPSDPA